MPHNSTQPLPGLHWTHVEQIHSTNAHLLDASEATNQLFSADSQTQGRGRQQQPWIDEGSSALFSISTPLPRSHNTAPLDISAWPVQVAITLATTLHTLAEDQTRIAIKWPNDLYSLNNGTWGKCGGILVESIVGQSGKVVTGLGLNLAPLDSSVSADYQSGFVPLPLTKKDTIVTLGNALFSAWQEFIQYPYVDPEGYATVDYLKDKELHATDLNSPAAPVHKGTGAGINKHAHLYLETEHGKIALSSQQRIRFAS